MTYIQELPERGGASSSRLLGKRFKLPFMTLLVGGLSALAVGLGALNHVLEDMVVAHSDLGALDQVEYISAEIVRGPVSQ